MIDNNITTPNSIFSTELLVAISILLLIIGSIIYLKKNKNKKNIQDDRNRLIDLEKNIREKLEKLEIEFHKEAINYYLPTLLLDSNLSREEKKEFLKERNHIKVISLERIDWSDFTIIGEEGNIFEKILEEKIKNFHEKDDYFIKDAFKFMLLEKAKKETQQIINEKEKSVQSTK